MFFFSVVLAKTKTNNNKKMEAHYGTGGETIRHPTFRKFSVLARVVAGLSVKDKRLIYQLMRKEDDTVDQNTLLPHFGITFGEFSVWQVLGEQNRKHGHSPPWDRLDLCRHETDRDTRSEKEGTYIHRTSQSRVENQMAISATRIGREWPQTRHAATAHGSARRHIATT